MADVKLDLLQSTLDLMVLQTLACMDSLHGYGIARSGRNQLAKDAAYWHRLSGVMGRVLAMAASFFMAQVIATLLFGTAPTDPIPFAGTILILSIVALVAGYLPARRASKIDPMIALRNN